jgi:hypothetical protein
MVPLARDIPVRPFDDDLGYYRMECSSQFYLKLIMLFLQHCIRIRSTQGPLGRFFLVQGV